LAVSRGRDQRDGLAADSELPKGARRLIWAQAGPASRPPSAADLGGIPIDYRDRDFVKEIRRLTGEGVDVVFDPIGGKRVVPYSIQTLKRLKPALFRQDLITLLDFLHQEKIKPLIAQRFPIAEARQAQELLGKGGVTGKIVLVGNGSSLQSGPA
jgi:NADPH:quinone reductase-like Zn-dependent oxidoreductase